MFDSAIHLVFMLDFVRHCQAAEPTSDADGLDFLFGLPEDAFRHWNRRLPIFGMVEGYSARECILDAVNNGATIAPACDIKL